MNFILKRANKNIEYLLERAESNGPDVFTTDMMADLVQQYRETLSKVHSDLYTFLIPFRDRGVLQKLRNIYFVLFQILPDMTSIIGKWQSLSKKEKTEGDATKVQNGKSIEEADDKETQGNRCFCILLQDIQKVLWTDLCI